jgi:hypothetical protein
MPCDSIVLNGVEVGKMHPALLKKALEALGARGVWQQENGYTYFELDGASCSIIKGRMSVPEGKEHLADKVKRAYSAEVVQYTAKRYNWTITKKGEFVYEVTK